jgi:hypothetical protein
MTPFFVEDKNGALRDALQTDHVFVEHAVVANHPFVEVAQQRKGQAPMIGERLERKERVDANPEDLRPVAC